MNYGYAEVRVKVADTNRAVHTAFWFQSPDVNLVDGTGNDGAEIDVFESAFVEDKTASTIHIDGYGNDHQENSKRYPAAGLHGSFHVWGMLWDENLIKIYYDGELKAEFSKEGGEENGFREPRNMCSFPQELHGLMREISRVLLSIRI